MPKTRRERATSSALSDRWSTDADCGDPQGVATLGPAVVAPPSPPSRAEPSPSVVRRGPRYERGHSARSRHAAAVVRPSCQATPTLPAAEAPGSSRAAKGAGEEAATAWASILVRARSLGVIRSGEVPRPADLYKKLIRGGNLPIHARMPHRAAFSDHSARRVVMRGGLRSGGLSVKD